MSIVKTFFGTHLDLSKVVQISDAKLVNEGYDLFVGFDIDVQLRDAPIRHKVRIDHLGQEDAVKAELQVQIDGLVSEWKGVFGGPVANEVSRPYREVRSELGLEDEDDASSAD